MSAEGGVNETAEQLLPVGLHECVTCKRCACTFASVHPACPYCSERDRLAAQVETLRQAINHAAYALNPNQGEPRDPIRASRWLHSTFPPDHPNYVDPAALGSA